MNKEEMYNDCFTYKNNKLDGEQADATEYQAGAHQWAMIVDIDKCIGCRRCLSACEQENHVPHEPELYRTWLERYETTADGSLKAEFVRVGVSAQRHHSYRRRRYPNGQ